MLRIDRFNGNTLRRYHVKNGAVVVINRERGKPRRVSVVPACMPIGVIAHVTPSTALELINEARALAGARR